jgi:predicted Fe-Mo cluster-binding NifX family protein
MKSRGHEIDPHGPVLAMLRDCKTVVSHGMGRRIYDDLRQAEIEVFVTDETEVEKVLKRYLDGELVDRPELGCDHRHEQ